MLTYSRSDSRQLPVDPESMSGDGSKPCICAWLTLASAFFVVTVLWAVLS